MADISGIDTLVLSGNDMDTPGGPVHFRCMTG